MTHYSGKTDHDVDVTGDVDISGQMNGNVTVYPGGQLRLRGQTNRNVMVLEGGILHQSGQLNGVLTCRGWAEITGQINGTIIIEGGVVFVAEGVQRNTGGQHLVLNSEGQWESGQDTSSVHATRRWQWNADGSTSLSDRIT
jgi:hypothetical protein